MRPVLVGTFRYCIVLLGQHSHMQLEELSKLNTEIYIINNPQHGNFIPTEWERVFRKLSPRPTTFPRFTAKIV